MLALPACPKAVRSSGCPQHQHELCCSTVTTLHRHTCNWEAFALQRWWVSSAKTTCEARKVRGRRHYLECHSVQNGYEGKHMVLHSSLSFVKNNPSAFPSIIAAVLPEDKKKKKRVTFKLCMWLFWGMICCSLCNWHGCNFRNLAQTAPRR